MIKILCLGRLKETYLKELVSDYLKRINKYHKIEIVELKDENDLEAEKNHLLNYITNRDYVITMDIEGNNLDSVSFANKLESVFIESSSIVFVIGSSLGLHEDIKKRANYSLSFSTMTFPHGLFRGILLEQIYRAFKIINNESYHK